MSQFEIFVESFANAPTGRVDLLTFHKHTQSTLLHCQTKNWNLKDTKLVGRKPRFYFWRFSENVHFIFILILSYSQKSLINSNTQLYFTSSTFRPLILLAVGLYPPDWLNIKPNYWLNRHFCDFLRVKLRTSVLNS